MVLGWQAWPIKGLLLLYQEPKEEKKMLHADSPYVHSAQERQEPIRESSSGKRPFSLPILLQSLAHGCLGDTLKP